MNLFEFIEFIATFIINNGKTYLEKKLFDFLWEKIKPILLKAGKKLWQIIKDKLQKIKKKWLESGKRKRARAGTQTLIFMNEQQNDDHSYKFVVMIIAINKHIIIIVVISLK